MSEHTHWGDNGQLLSSTYDDIYFSTENGLEESRYVFIQNNQLEKRFRQLPAGDMFVIAETGFGTGLNFLATSQLWQKMANKHSHLHFISVEKFPLQKNIIQQALQCWPELDELRQALLDQYPTTIKGIHRITLQHNITLTLIVDDATTGLQQLVASPIRNDYIPTSYKDAHQQRQWQGVDAWFLDGFAPGKNPDMWTPELFTTMARLSKRETTFATFTAAGVVKRSLTTAGFLLKKVSGYGRKREMLIGHYSIENKKAASQQSLTQETSIPKKPNRYSATPWPLIHDYARHYGLENTCPEKNKTIAIIGGGIAGCHTAYALANKGYRVTLFEKSSQLANGASGNAQGIVYAKLAAHDQTLGNINLHSLLYAQRFYGAFWHQADSKTTPALQGQQCGVLQLALTEKLQNAQQQIAKKFSGFADNICYVSKEKASDIAGTTLDFPALYFPHSGWINPTALCQWLTQHPLINVVTDAEVLSLEQRSPSDNNKTPLNHWQLTVQKDQKLERLLFHSVVICNAQEASQFTQTQPLPTKSIRGQVTHLPTSNISEQLTTVICGKGYIAPASTNHCLGASYNLNSTVNDLQVEDHKQNLLHISQQVPDIIDEGNINDDLLAKLEGRVGFRCATPDYLPLVGPVPIQEEMHENYRALQKNAREIIPTMGSYYPHLYLNIGHGSRGLTYTPLCAQIIASLVSGSPPPTNQTLVQALNPARFIIRQLIRG